MAREALTIQTPTRSGLTPSFTAAIADGHKFPNDGTRVLRVKNTSGSIVTVSVAVGATVDGNAVAAKTFTVPATTGDVITGTWPPGDYNQPDGTLWVDYSATPSVTVAVLDF